jgi:Domain of unknown function (DUF4388)
MAVSDLLQFLAAGRKTGTLKFARRGIVKQIFLEQGTIVGSASNDPKEAIGQVLLHYGKITEPQLREAMETHRESGDRLGSVLSARAFVSQADIMYVLRMRTLEIIYDLFIWEEAEFEFFDGDPLPADVIRIKVDATNVIMDGIYRIDEWARYRKAIPSDRTFFELIPGWTQSLPESSKETREILYHIEKGLTAAEICYNMHTSPFHAFALVFALIEKGTIKVAGEAPPPIEAPADLSALRLPQTVAELLKLARAEMTEENVENALAIINSALDMEPKSGEALRLRDNAEKKFVTHVYQNGISPRAVPKLVASLAQLENERLGPQEGFVLSRINGESDVGSILSVCPFREADTLRMIKKLVDSGILGL